jgi:hypothetical protein
MSAAELLEPQAAAPAAGAVARRLVVTWQHPEERSIEPIGFLTYDGQSYRFEYIRNALGVTDFRPLIGFPDLDSAYRSNDLFPLFSQRAMDPRRPDFSRYVTRLGLSEDTSPWEQIARSGGRREGDTLQLFPEPVVQDGSITCAFLVHGIRWIGSRPLTLSGKSTSISRADVERALMGLTPGDPLQLINEPDNPSNPAAILVADRPGTPIGYVPNLLVADLHRLANIADVAVQAEVVNGPDAPWHMRVLARLQADGPSGFRFFEGDTWEPISAA